MEPLNGWTKVSDADAIARGRRAALLEWLARRRGLDPSDGVLFFRSGRAWVLSTVHAAIELGVQTWGPRTFDRDLAMREAWADATGRVGEPEADAIRDRLSARLAPVPAQGGGRGAVNDHGNPDREQLALLGRR